MRYDFTGNGANELIIGTLPNFSAPQAYMFVTAAWIVEGHQNSHLQIDQNDNRLKVLKSGNGVIYRGQITIMI